MAEEQVPNLSEPELIEYLWKHLRNLTKCSVSVLKKISSFFLRDNPLYVYCTWPSNNYTIKLLQNQRNISQVVGSSCYWSWVYEVVVFYGWQENGQSLLEKQFWTRGRVTNIHWWTIEKLSGFPSKTVIHQTRYYKIVNKNDVAYILMLYSNSKSVSSHKMNIQLLRHDTTFL